MQTPPPRSVNFLRGVPAEKALAELLPAAARGYEQALLKYGTQVLQYGHFNGFAPLREAIARIHGVAPDRVVAGNGGLEVISLFFKSLPKDSLILVEEISYDRVLIDAVRYGHRLAGVPLTPDGVDLERFAALVRQSRPRVFYGIPYHQNPTGIIYSPDNRKEVARICRENDVFCVWDVCYQSLRYDGKSNDSVAISDWGPILTSSFTKTISPGTKCGYIIVPESYTAHLSHVVANTRINPNLPTQAFIAEFIESGRFDAYVRDLHQLYRPRMEALNQALAAHFPNDASKDITGGFFACLTFPGINRDRESAFLESAGRNGVTVSPAWDAVAPDFRDRLREKGLLVRLTFPAFDPENIAWGIETLKKTFDAFQ